MLSPNTQQAIELLRDPVNMSWYLVPLISFVVYAIYFEIDRKNLSRVLAAFAFVGADLFNEIWNGLVLHFSGFAPVWGISGPSAFRVLIGWNVEIILGFLLTGLAATMALPSDKNLKILGMNNRLFFIIFNSIACVCFEIILNQAGIIIWEWPWWNAQQPWLIFLIGYVPFFAVCYWIYDMTSTKKQLITLSSIYGFNGILLVTFGSLGWI